VTVPERHYELAAHLMAGALETGTPLAECARSAGADLPVAGDDVRSLLERHGFEPRADGRDVVLRNCPFHQLARTHPDLVCGMTLGLLSGMLGSLGADLTARPEPSPGHCCVRLAAR
jgi:predicted ArsR family transcriptional regulator